MVERHRNMNVMKSRSSIPSPPTTSFGYWLQFRRECFGDCARPYLRRWMLIVCGYSIRLHHWMRSDDDRFYHDHACDFISIVLKGIYYNHTPSGIFCIKAGQIWTAKARWRHYLKIPRKGAWTLMLCGRPYHKWGFYVPRTTDGVIRRLRPLDYFSRYGIRQVRGYQ